MFVYNKIKSLRVLKIVIISIFTICLTSCLEIIEDVKVNSNGSGTFKLIVNASQSASQISKILAQDSIRNYAIPKESTIKNRANQIIEKLKAQDGISNVSYSLDLKEYIFKLDFDFKDINQLNTAVSEIVKKETNLSQGDIKIPILYSLENGVFSKTYDSALINKAAKQKKEVEAFLTNLDKATITSIYRFDTEIENNSHKGSKITANKKTCFEKVKLIQLLDNQGYHTHNIQLK